MKKNLILFYLVIQSFSLCLAQEKISRDLLYGDLTFGFETNEGNTGTLTGVGYQRNISKKLMFQTDLQYFTTEIITNKWQYAKGFPKEERFARSTFLSAMLGYAVIGKTDKFNITVKGGVSIIHIKQKSLSNIQYTFYPEGNLVPDSDPGYIMYSHQSLNPITGQMINGTGIVNPSSLRYGVVNKFDKGFNLGLDINIPVNRKSVLTVGFLSYSSDIFLQYLFCPLPVISYKVKL